MRKVIIIGGSSFIGIALTKKMILEKIEVIIVVRNKKKYLEKMQSRILDKITIVECDLENITDLSNKIQDRDIDVFYNFAWSGIGNRDELMNYNIQVSNIKFNLDAMIVAKSLGCKKYIGSGSIAQFENKIEQYKIMQDRECYYRIAKEACEKMGNELAVQIDIEFIWPIITNVYGFGEKNKGRLINTLLDRISNCEDMDLSLGEQIYDFVYIDDAAQAFYLIGLKGRGFRKYVIGSGEAKKLRNWLQQIPEILNCEDKLNFGKLEYKGAYLTEEHFDIKNLKEDTGYSPKVSFEEGIKKTYNWQKGGFYE